MASEICTSVFLIDVFRRVWDRCLSAEEPDTDGDLVATCSYTTRVRKVQWE